MTLDTVLHKQDVTQGYLRLFKDVKRVGAVWGWEEQNPLQFYPPPFQTVF